MWGSVIQELRILFHRGAADEADVLCTQFEPLSKIKAARWNRLEETP